MPGIGSRFSAFSKTPETSSVSMMSPVEKAKEIITRFGGTVTEVEDAGKKRLAYEIQKMKEAFYYFIQFESC